MLRSLSVALTALSLMAQGAAAAESTNHSRQPGQTAQPTLHSPVTVLAQVARDSQNRYGSPAPAHTADRVIEIRPGRKFVTVTSGETILFKVNGKAFTWRFTPSVTYETFDLEKIAPQDVDVRGIRVYCVPDLYQRAG